jgi:membrane protease YdiL (CAAX protease family)
MDEVSFLTQGLFLIVLSVFTHWVGYKKDLFSILKISYQTKPYPVLAGILSLLSIFFYLFPFPYIAWYAPLILLLFYFALKSKEQFISILKDKMTLPKTSLLWDVTIGLTIFIVSLPFLSFLQNSLEWILTYFFQMEVPRQFFIDFIRQIKENKPLLTFFFVLVCILVPAYEEFLYRANIQTWLKNYLSPFWAIFVTSLFFAVSHFFTIDTVPGKIIVIITTFAASMYLGFSYERQRSLITSITYHSMINTLTFVQVLLGS